MDEWKSKYLALMVDNAHLQAEVDNLTARCEKYQSLLDDYQRVVEERIAAIQAIIEQDNEG